MPRDDRRRALDCYFLACGAIGGFVAVGALPASSTAALEGFLTGLLVALLGHFVSRGLTPH